jgi:ABC-type amino acid transport substrate-binding protein
MHANKDANFTILKKKLMPNNVAYFFPKTKKGEQLRDQVNKTLKAMIKDGTVSKITKKYLYADMTKQIDQTQSKKYGTAHYND